MTNNERGERFQLAYEMAWFIHRNKQIAYHIALEVACRWEIAPPQGQRTLSREQKFQRLSFQYLPNLMYEGVFAGGGSCY